MKDIFFEYQLQKKIGWMQITKKILFFGLKIKRILFSQKLYFKKMEKAH